MRPCAAYRVRLLEVDVAELDRSAETELTRHLDACEGCREAAARIVRRQQALSATLDARPGIDAAAIVARARLDTVPGGARAGNGPPDATVRPSTGRRPHRPWTRWSAAGLAAAAVATAVFVRLGEHPLPVAVPVGPQEHPLALVEPADDRSVAVIPTDHPDITIIWFF